MIHGLCVEDLENTRSSHSCSSSHLQPCSDIQEASVEVDGQPVFRCPAIYGFRNIQGLVRRMKLGKSPYDFVEIMACPSGCLNGGGQIRPAPGQSPAAIVQALEEGYTSLREGAPRTLRESAALDGFVDAASDEWGFRIRPEQRALLETGYHAREKSVTSVLRDW